MRRLLFVLLCLLAGCASLPGQFALPRDPVQAFTVDGRFGLKITRPDQAAQSIFGGLSWLHRADFDQLFLSGPLGSGQAELTLRPGAAQMRLSNGQVRTASDPDALFHELTGYPLPVSRLSAWLLGQPGADGELLRDDRGRPLRLREQGWQLDYHYDRDAADALPVRLDIVRDGELSLRLRIENWRFDENPNE